MNTTPAHHTSPTPSEDPLNKPQQGLGATPSTPDHDRHDAAQPGHGPGHHSEADTPSADAHGSPHHAHAHQADGAASQAHGGHMQGGHMQGGHGDHVGQFRRLFWIMLVLAVPVVLFSDMFAMILGYALPDVPAIAWVSPVLGTVMYVWGGKPFLTGALSEVRAKSPGMMLLVALAITVAFVSSVGSSLGLLSHELDFWWELALLIVIMLLGHWIEMRSLAQSSSALESLAALLPDQAERLDGDQVTTVPPAELVLGDVVIVRPGGRVPADGQIIDGTADVDESMITGESRPVTRTVGEKVVAGTVSTDSALRVQITAVGDDTALAGIQRLVTQAQSSSSKAQLLADKAAGWLFWFALAAAAITFVTWTLLGVPDSALIRTITVLVIACPHALGLAIPLVVSIATERAARGGVLITDRMALEAMRTVDTVLFDKTGTLTKGEPVVTDIATTGRLSEDDLIAWSAAVESDSEHPLARAIMTDADNRGLTRPRVTNFTASTAVGVSAVIDGHTVSVGGPALLKEHQLEPQPASEAWKADGAIILHVLIDGEIAGAIGLADEVRQESREAVAALHKIGKRVVMITGDAEQVAHTVAAELSIDQVFAGVRPEDKGDKAKELQAQGRRVAMVGDGVNDAPALAQADVGIAIGAGTDVAIASAGVVLASDDPRSVLSVIELSNASYRKMKQNLAWAAGYNLISVPLAAGVLAPIGFILPMAIGALLMSVSTLVVAANAQLLRRLDLRPQSSTTKILRHDPPPPRRAQVEV